MESTMDISSLDNTVCKDLLKQLFDKGTVQCVTPTMDVPQVKRQKFQPQPSTSGTTGETQVGPMPAIPPQQALLSQDTSLQANKCELPLTYITMRHGQVLINSDFLSGLQKDHDIFFSLTDLANGVSVGLVPSNAHVVPSLPSCGVVRLYHPTCPETDLFYRLQT